MQTQTIDEKMFKFYCANQEGIDALINSGIFDSNINGLFEVYKKGGKIHDISYTELRYRRRRTDLLNQ